MSKKSTPEISKPYAYKPINYGLDNELTGKGVTISILDTGRPDHNDICNIDCDVNTDDENNSFDRNGHATMVTGIIKANNPKAIQGIAPEAKCIYAKVIDDSSQTCDYSSLLTGTLWSIVKNADIMLISLGSKTDYSILNDAIQKAVAAGVCIISASGPPPHTEFPAAYDGVFSVGEKASKKYKYTPSVLMENKSLWTTSLNHQYIKASGTSINAGLCAGLASLIIEEKRAKGTACTPKVVYRKLKSVIKSI